MDVRRPEFGHRFPVLSGVLRADEPEGRRERRVAARVPRGNQPVGPVNFATSDSETSPAPSGVVRQPVTLVGFPPSRGFLERPVLLAISSVSSAGWPTASRRRADRRLDRSTRPATRSRRPEEESPPHAVKPAATRTSTTERTARSSLLQRIMVRCARRSQSSASSCAPSAAMKTIANSTARKGSSTTSSSAPASAWSVCALSPQSRGRSAYQP